MNTIIQGLVVANIVDQILREYGKAFGIHYDLTNMSNMNMNMSMNMQNTSNSDSVISSSLSCFSNKLFYSEVEKNENNNNYTDTINFEKYQSAQLSESVIRFLTVGYAH